MNSIFVTLALLLMALSRSSSVTFRDWSSVDMYAKKKMGSESPFSLNPAEKAEQYGKFVLGNLSRTQKEYLNNHLGNTIYAMILDRLGKYDSLPAYYKNALNNGVLCEVTNRVREGAIKSIQYGVHELSAEESNNEYEAAQDPAIDINCASSDYLPEYNTCFCQYENVLLYCAALKFKARFDKAAGAVKRTCEPDLFTTDQHHVMDRFHNMPSTSTRPFNHTERLTSFYFNECHDELFVKAFSTAPMPWGGPEYEEVGAGRQRAADRYCMATDAAAEAMIKNLFAANALRWTLEGYPMQAAFNGAHKDIDSACASEAFKNSDVGKCACTKDTGITFCFAKVRAQHYRKIGYLNCTIEEYHFNDANKPAIIPAFRCLSDSVFAATATECEAYRKGTK